MKLTIIIILSWQASKIRNVTEFRSLVVLAFFALYPWP